MTPEPEDTREAFKEAIKEITGEHKAVKLESNGNKMMVKVLLTILGVMTAAFVTTAIGFFKSCSTVEVVDKYATRIEVISLDNKNNQEHSAINAKLEVIERNSEKILDAVLEIKRRQRGIR